MSKPKPVGQPQNIPAGKERVMVVTNHKRRMVWMNR